MIDLRSDTVTRPTPAMRAAIAAAEVGDEALGDDPTAARLERRVADLLGKEAAALFPSGIMANETALCVLAPRGTEVICEANSHFVDWELGAAGAIAGVQLRPVAGTNGILSPDDVAAAIRPPFRHQLRTSVIALENTHNGAGGRIFPLETMQAVRAIADEHGIPVHLDGARLWHASVATGTPERAWAACADTVMVALSKGLGCPIGSMLAGPTDVIEQARVVRRRLGGGMRQTGILAAAGLYALDHHRERLAEDHARARDLADGVAQIAGLRVVAPETNIVMIDVDHPALDADAIVRRAREQGVLLTAFTPRRVRAITHLDIDDAGIARACEVISSILTSAG